MSTTARHKAVCTACRARKKKCDGEKPACSSCRKRKMLCSYGPARISGISWGSDPAMSMDWDPFFAPAVSAEPGPAIPGFAATQNTLFPVFGDQPAMPWDTLLQPLISPNDLPVQPSVGGLTPPFSNGSDTARPSMALPLPDKILELVDLFFDRVHWYLPIFHKKTLKGSIGTHCPLLLYSVIAVAARAHPDPGIRECQQPWFNEAKALYEATSHVPEPALEGLQAAICIIIHSLAMGDHATSLLVLGKAWRQAVALGFHQLDSPSRTVLPGLTLPSSSDWRDMEQRRRVVWTLFILDRAMCFPAGLLHVVDDRQLRIFLPMSESLFQDSETPPEQSDLQFSANLKKIITQVSRTRGKTPNMLDYLVLAHALLGRIVEHMFAPEYDQAEQDELEALLSQARLAMPRSATDLAAASHADFRHVVWLRVMMDVNTIFLYHRPSSQGHEHTIPEIQGTHEGNWQRCIAAARSTALLIREASGISTDLLMSPLMAAPIFTCGRVLAVEYLLSPQLDPGSGRAALRADLEAMTLIFDRLDEAFGGILCKFRIALLYHLGQDEDAIREVKAGGSRGFLTSCTKWPTREDVEVQGFPD